jgi:protein SCO1
VIPLITGLNDRMRMGYRPKCTTIRAPSRATAIDAGLRRRGQNVTLYGRGSNRMALKHLLAPLVGGTVFVLVLVACAHGIRAPAFELRDDVGQRWALQDQKSSVVLVFGYTHCTDTCPLMLAKLSKARRRAGPSPGPIEVAFVTVDPVRDTPRVLRNFVTRFGSGVVGLTGTPSQIEAVERSYHVWSQPLPSIPGTHDYDEAHSSTMFFIDRRREIVSLHDPTDSVAELARAMQQL